MSGRLLPLLETLESISVLLRLTVSGQIITALEIVKLNSVSISATFLTLTKIDLRIHTDPTGGHQHELHTCLFFQGRFEDTVTAWYFI